MTERYVISGRDFLLSRQVASQIQDGGSTSVSSDNLKVTEISPVTAEAAGSCRYDNPRSRPRRRSRHLDFRVSKGLIQRT